MAYLGRKGASAALTSADIPDNSITAAKISPDTIVAADLAPDSVDSSELVDLSIDTSHIGNLQRSVDRAFYDKSRSIEKFCSREFIAQIASRII